MSCPKTEHLMKEYFADDLSDLASQEMEKHLSQCAFCSEELGSLLNIQSNLLQWEEQRSPHWDRGAELFRREHQVDSQYQFGFKFWQWLPTAASFAMLALVMFNTSVVVGEQGFSVSFGATADSSVFTAQLMELERSQEQEFAALVARVEDRQDSNNLQLMQAVFDQNQQTTAENLERIYAFFEQQRLQDLEDMRVGYEELVNNDFETIRSLEQLARFVSFEEPVR